MKAIGPWRSGVNHFVGHSYLAHILTVATGAALAQVLVLIAAPVLSRLYGPDDFGVLGSYVGIVAILAVVAGGRYELAIALCKERADAVSLFWLSHGLALGFSIAVLFGVAVFRNPVAELLQAPELASWLWLAPLSLFLTASLGVFNYWSTRHKEFRQVSASGVLQVLVTLLVQLAGGVARGGLGGVGLFVGQLAGAFAATGFLGWRVLREHWRTLRDGFDRKGIRRMAVEYRGLPSHSMTTAFVNTLSTAALPIVLAITLGPMSAGLAVLAQRIVIQPVQLFGAAIWQVTHARLGPIDTEDKVALFSAVHRYASWGFAYPLAAIAVFSYFSADVFGESWTEMQFLLPPIALMVFAGGVSNATSYFAAFGFYRQESVANVTLVALRLGALVVASIYGGVVAVIAAYAGASALVYVGINMFWGRTFRKSREFLVNLLASLSASMVLLAIVRTLLGFSFLSALAGVLVVGLAYYAVLARVLIHQGGERLDGNASHP